MDGDRFDSLTKSLAGNGLSRRRVVRALLGGAAGFAGFRQAAGATPVTGACHALCQPQAVRDRRPCYDVCLACNGDTSQVCRGEDGSFSCCDGGGDECNAPACIAGTCGTTPVHENGPCNGGSGTCQRGTCVPTVTCIADNAYCVPLPDAAQCCGPNRTCYFNNAAACPSAYTCCGNAGASCSGDCDCCGALTCSANGTCMSSG